MNRILFFNKANKGILWLLLFILIIYFANVESRNLNDDRCEKFKRESFYGKIEKKYIDVKQHNYHMLVISKSNSRDSSFNLEQSGFWNYVQVNDSILKKENSFEFYIINRDTSFTITTPNFK